MVGKKVDRCADCSRVVAKSGVRVVVARHGAAFNFIASSSSSIFVLFLFPLSLRFVCPVRFLLLPLLVTFSRHGQSWWK